jgi:hypothetical protein
MHKECHTYFLGQLTEQEYPEDTHLSKTIRVTPPISRSRLGHASKLRFVKHIAQKL